MNGKWGITMATVRQSPLARSYNTETWLDFWSRYDVKTTIAFLPNWYCLQRDETDDDCLVSYRSLDCPTVCGCAGLHIPKHLKVIDQLDATIALLRKTNSLYYPLGGMLVVEMSKFWHQTEKSKYCRKSSNESIYKLSSTLPSTLSKFQEMQELHLNETIHCTLRRGACHTVGYLSKPLCLENAETFLQKTNGCQYHVQMKPYSQFSGYIS